MQENVLRFSKTATTGVIIKGPGGSEKIRLASEMSRLFTCTQEGLADCRCASCQSFFMGQHPDITWVKRDEGSRSIGIDLVRTYLRLGDKPALGRRRCVIVQDFGSMTEEAQNAVLKVSEDFSDRLIIIGLYESGSLLDTIMSRMAVFEMPPMSEHEFLIAVKDHPALVSGTVSGKDLYLMTGGYPERKVDVKLFGQVLLAVRNRDQVELLKTLHMWVEGDKQDYFTTARDQVSELVAFFARIFLWQLQECVNEPERLCELILMCGREEETIKKAQYSKMEWTAFISKIVVCM